MNVFEVAVFLLILVVLYVILDKMKRLQDIYQKSLIIQNNIETMVKENSKIIDIITEELESKITEANNIVKYFEDNTFIVPDMNEGLPLPGGKNKKPAAAKKGKEAPPDPDIELLELLEDGLSIREIAEHYKTTQGEIALKLNLLQKRHLRSLIRK